MFLHGSRLFEFRTVLLSSALFLRVPSLLPLWRLHFFPARPSPIMSVSAFSSGAALVSAGESARPVVSAAAGVLDSQLPVVSPFPSEEEMAGLPDLAGPSEFAGALGSGLPDPMAVDGLSEVEALRESLLRDITAAGARGKVPLAGD